jgi:hypothetical protein
VRNLGGEIWLNVETPLVHTGPHEFVGAPTLRCGSSEALVLQRAANG